MAEVETQPCPLIGSSPNSKSLPMIAERRHSRGSAHDVFARLKSADQIKSSDEDMFGNVYLHHAFASINPDFVKIQKVIKESPAGASIKNQFGRIPLHYAVDKSKVDLGCVLLLLKVRAVIGITKEDRNNSSSSS